MKRLLLVVTTLLCLCVPATALAYNPLHTACDAGGGAKQQSSACSAGTSDPITGSHGILRKISTIVAIIAGIAAVIILIAGGLEYVTAAGDPQKAAGARNTIIGAIVGLIIIAAAEGIIVFVLNTVK